MNIKNILKKYKKPVEGDEPASVIYLPLVQQKKVIGVVTTQSFEKNAYTGYHINLLRNLATYAAIALDNASAYRQLNATLSELKTTQKQLVQQEKLASLGQLTAGIAHEIKNPLNFVNNFSEVSLELVEEALDSTEDGGRGTGRTLPFRQLTEPGLSRFPCEVGPTKDGDQLQNNEANSNSVNTPLNPLSRTFYSISSTTSRPTCAKSTNTAPGPIRL